MKTKLKLSNVLCNLDEFFKRKKIYFNGNFNAPSIPEKLKIKIFG